MKFSCAYIPTLLTGKSLPKIILVSVVLALYTSRTWVKRGDFFFFLKIMRRGKILQLRSYRFVLCCHVYFFIFNFYFCLFVNILILSKNHYYICNSQARNGDWQNMAKLFAADAATNPTNGNLQSNHAAMLVEAGRWEEAGKLWKLERM